MFSIIQKINTKINYNLLKQNYNYYMPLFIIMGGLSGVCMSITTLESESHKKKLKPIEGFGIIIGGFSIGLISGIFYPITGIITGCYVINKIIKDN